jgi:polar amino acid transport system substrate-binding protein
MDSVLPQLHSIIISMEQTEYTILGIVIILFFLAIHLYSLAKEKRKLRETINHNVKVFQKAFDLAEDAMLILSETNKVIFANKSMISLLDLEIGYQLEVLRHIPKVKIKKEWIALDKFIETQQVRMEKKALIFPQVMIKVEGHTSIAINLHLDAVSMDNQKNQRYSIITIQDLTQTHIAEKMKYRHKLTNMPNQTQALHDLPALFSKIHTENNKIALVLLAFDNFSRLRAIIGFEQSNEIIIKFSNYLNTITSDMNVSAYHTFDNHFLLTVSNVDSVESITLVVSEIQTRLATFYKMEDVSLHLTVSAGIALYPESGPTRTLLDNTYKALAQAQKDADGDIVVYIPDKFITDYDELTLHNDMQKGLDNDEFEVYYQPIIKVENEEVVGAEALIRWIHPQYGFIPPDVFIGLMEKTGFIVKLGQFVLEEVLKQQKRWELFKFKQIHVSINVSMIEIATGDFVEHVEQELIHHQVNPELIKFEITEGTAMISEIQTEKYFYKLKKLGVGISLDDFGTGYTSFTYLKKFPADILKIDKSLVDHILLNEEDQRIVKAMIELGHNLGMKIVVEGIETKKMVELLASYECDYMQGYYFDKPLPVFEFQKLLR